MDTITNTQRFYPDKLNRTVATYLEVLCNENKGDPYVIRVVDNTFLKVVIYADMTTIGPFRTSLLSASCFESESIAKSIIGFLGSNGVNTSLLAIRKLSDYLKLKD